MSNLSINELPNDLPIVKRLKKSLLKGIKFTSSKDLDKAVILANYLCAMGQYKEAVEILDSFILSVKSTPDRRDVWGSNGQGIILRAYIAELQGDPEIQSQLINLLVEDDIMTDRCGRYELYLECLEDHEENISYALSETQKYKCEVIGQEALTFLYFYKMLPFYKNEAPEGFKGDLKKLLDECYTKLKTALIDG